MGIKRGCYDRSGIPILAISLTHRESNLRRFLAYNAAEAEFGGVCKWSISVSTVARGNKG